MSTRSINIARNTFEPASFDIEIFSAPKPFVGEDRNVNLRAIRSWQRLTPRPKITLLGHELGYDQVATEYGLNIRSDVDQNFLGVPLFNSMFHIANSSKADVTVIINGDIILTNDFISTMKKVRSRFKDYLMVSARYDLEKLPHEINEENDSYEEKLREYSLNHGKLHTYGGMDLWAWNPDGPPLFDVQMPPFIFGRGKYDNWLTHETIATGRRHVIDASESVMSVHIRHDHSRVFQSGKSGLQDTFWSEGKRSKFELFVNIYLSSRFGSYKNQMGNILYAPWRISRCLEAGGTCLVRRVRPGICNCEYSPSSAETQTDPIFRQGSRIIKCGSISQETKADYEIPVMVPGSDEEPQYFGLPLTLRTVVERVVEDNTVILSAMNFGYRDIMMNWVCNMRELKIMNFVVAAFDAQLYRYAFLRGVPVYLETTMMFNSSVLDASYGTDSFKQLSKLKSRIVLRVLKLGYDVVWTDTDIVWFRNPLNDLKGHNADLIIQSNAPDGENANEKRRINSGFYLVHRNNRTINAFEDIIAFAKQSNMSEQPCFYDVICGKKGERKVGNDRCLYGEMTLQLLDRNLYPNGNTHRIWELPAGTILLEFPNLFILHNNWIKGSREKQKRLKMHGFLMFDKDLGICKYASLSAKYILPSGSELI
ncbi:unnamed protein product [Agarophyton chilense]